MDKDSICIDTLIHGPVGKVWKAWTEPDLVSKWFGSDLLGSRINARIDCHTGGSCEISFSYRDGTEFSCGGIYAEVQPYGKLGFSWEWKNEPGVESFVTLMFTPENNDMHFEHAGVGFKSAHNYLEGWKSAFAKLDSLISQNPRPSY